MHASLHIYTYYIHMFTKVLSSMVRNVRSNKGVFLASKLHS